MNDVRDSESSDLRDRQGNQSEEAYYVEEDSESYYEENDVRSPPPQAAKNLAPVPNQRDESLLINGRNEDEALLLNKNKTTSDHAVQRP